MRKLWRLRASGFSLWPSCKYWNLSFSSHSGKNMASRLSTLHTLAYRVKLASWQPHPSTSGHPFQLRIFASEPQLLILALIQSLQMDWPRSSGPMVRTGTVKLLSAIHSTPTSLSRPRDGACPVRNSLKARTALAPETPLKTVEQPPRTPDGHPKRTSLWPLVPKSGAESNSKRRELIPTKMVFTRKVTKLALQMRSRDKTWNLITLWWTRLVRARAPTVTCHESTRLLSKTVFWRRSLHSHLPKTTISSNTGRQYGRQLTLGEHAAPGTFECHPLTLKTLRIPKVRAREIWRPSWPRLAPVKDKIGTDSPADLLNNHPILKKYSLMCEY